jgi:hypothetical protein
MAILARVSAGLMWTVRPHIDSTISIFPDASNPVVHLETTMGQTERVVLRGTAAERVVLRGTTGG